MNRFLISYDLQKTKYVDKDYDELYAYLEKLGAVRVQESVWAVRSGRTAIELRRTIARHFHSEDRLLVVRIDGHSSVNGLALINEL